METQKSQLVEMAQVFLNRAIDVLEVACKDDSNAQAYLVDHLKIAASNDHGFATCALNLDQLIIEQYEGEEIEVDSEWYDEFDELI
jgi:hypothetical protein